MFELIYTSVAEKDMSKEDILEILTCARINNEVHGITGMLIYSNREFVQLIEGEKDKIKALYDNIKADNRHTSVKVFHEGYIQSRSFAGWSMSFRELTDQDDLSEIPGFEAWGSVEHLLIKGLNNSSTGKELFLYLRKSL